MRARDIVGKRVARVEQSRIQPRENEGRTEWVLDRIVFNDGTVLYFVALETDWEPVVHAGVRKPRKEAP